jgi:hypothetical protein
MLAADIPLPLCRAPLTPTQHPDLWEKIRRFELDDPAAAFSFTDRLARENGWPLEYALRTGWNTRSSCFCSA